MTRALRPSTNWLLAFVAVAIVLRYGAPSRQTFIFFSAALGIIPLAGWLGRATEHLTARCGEGVGGLLNATFGNAAELIIGLMALKNGLTAIVKASLTGSIIGNILLVLGASILAGGVRRKVQRFNASGARSQSTMLLLAAIAMIAPATYHHLTGPAQRGRELNLSTEISVVLLFTYAVSLLFSLHTHKAFFVGKPTAAEEVEGSWSLSRSIAVLGASTGLIAWVSEILVGSVESAASSLGMSDLFVGVIIVAIIGNAAEHSSAIRAAWHDRMDLSLGIAVGSSIQIALFVAPALVLASFLLAPHPMELLFTPAELLAVGLAVLITSQIAGDGESNWLEGVQLLAVYVIFGLVFYFLPETAETARQH